MASGRRPGHECVSHGGDRVNDGTLCLQPSPQPGSLGMDPPTDTWLNASPVRQLARTWSDTGKWFSDVGDRVAGHSKSLLLTIIDWLPLKQESPFSTALLKHYVERSGNLYQLGEVPVEWQDWIVKQTGGRLGKHRELDPYNSGLFDLRNSLGHFDVEVKAASGKKKVYVLSDIYQFGFKKNDKAQRGRHGFPLGTLDGRRLEMLKKLLPTEEYNNPGGFKEKWEIRTLGKETTLLIPQQYLAEQGRPFPVTGTFER